jgi:hypothetical protein
MRLSVAVILALVACTETESPEQVFEDLVAKNEIDCGATSVTTTSVRCLDQVEGQQALGCMNDALASGARAAFGVGSLDSDFFTMDTTMFTVDHQVLVYVSYPEGDGHHYAKYAVEQPTCAGPFELSERCGGGPGSDFGLMLDGCP